LRSLFPGTLLSTDLNIDYNFFYFSVYCLHTRPQQPLRQDLQVHQTKSVCWIIDSECQIIKICLNCHNFVIFLQIWFIQKHTGQNPYVELFWYDLDQTIEICLNCHDFVIFLQIWFILEQMNTYDRTNMLNYSDMKMSFIWPWPLKSNYWNLLTCDNFVIYVQVWLILG
jgi:hypothetical protein